MGVHLPQPHYVTNRLLLTIHSPLLRPIDTYAVPNDR